MAGVSRMLTLVPGVAQDSGFSYTKKA